MGLWGILEISGWPECYSRTVWLEYYARFVYLKEELGVKMKRNSTKDIGYKIWFLVKKEWKDYYNDTILTKMI